MPRPQYTLDGFDALRRNLKRADLKGELKEINRETASVLIRDADAKKSALAARFPAYKKIDLQPSATVNYVQILVKGEKQGRSGRKIPFAAEFGAHTHPVYGRMLSQERFKNRVWPRWSGNDEGAGYMVYPTLREKEADIRDIYEAAMDRVLLQVAAGI